MTPITLPWPNGSLWPNRKAHWSVVSRHRKVQRVQAWALCTIAQEAGTPAPPISLKVTIHPPRRPGMTNVDGCISALKGAVDGIADAFRVDDSELRISWPTAFSEPVKGGAIVVDVA